MNPNLKQLQPYPFERLRLLLQLEASSHKDQAINLSIGEPSHASPAAVLQSLSDNLATLGKYPPTAGPITLRTAIANWLNQRFQLASHSIDPANQVLPVNGTREALFAIVQCEFDQSQKHRPLVVMPNPFYQIYEGAALLAGAKPYFYNTSATNNYTPDFDTIDASVWQKCQILYLCTPGNPAGNVITPATLVQLMELAHRHNFTIVSDECYSEIYPQESNPPAGLLQVAAANGNAEFRHCLVFNSLSKRSNLPGLRSGFVAGDSNIIKRFLLYRTYHGCAMSGPTAAASIIAWQDENHVLANRLLYREKFDSVLQVLSTVLEIPQPEGGFFLWAKLPGNDEQFTRSLYNEKNVTVLPGSYLSRQNLGCNPGYGHVRLALVQPLEQCIEAACRISDFLQGH